MSDKTILLSCPVRNRDWIIPNYLEHIYNIDYPKDKISILWIVNQSTDESEKLLKEFKKKYQHEYKNITIKKNFGAKKIPNDTRFVNVRNNHIYSHLSDMRNCMLKNIRKNDYLLSIDSDILVRPNILKKLLSHKLNICSGIIYNGFHKNPDEPWRYPNILRKTLDNKFEHISNTYVKNSPHLTDSKVVEVGLTGAVVLLSREVCLSTEYGYHPVGEDAYWSIDCERKGYKLYADYSVYCFHAMDKVVLKDYMNKNNNIKGEPL